LGGGVLSVAKLTLGQEAYYERQVAGGLDDYRRCDVASISSSVFADMTVLFRHAYKERRTLPLRRTGRMVRRLEAKVASYA
jgi:hypothetical protein